MSGCAAIRSAVHTALGERGMGERGMGERVRHGSGLPIALTVYIPSACVNAAYTSSV